jgi:hypothetical protein
MIIMCSDESLKNNNIEMLGFDSIEALRNNNTQQWGVEK